MPFSIGSFEFYYSNFLISFFFAPTKFFENKYIFEKGNDVKFLNEKLYLVYQKY